MKNILTQQRETPVTSEGAKLLRETNRKLNPTRLFTDRNRLAQFWFLIATLAVVTALLQPAYLTNILKQRERVVILDPAGTYHVAPLLDFGEATDMHIEQGEIAALSLLQRNPKGFDHQDLLEKILLTNAHKKAHLIQQRESKEFKAKHIHQKVEVSKIDILETRTGSVLSQITGQLIRSGNFEGEHFVEPVPFRLLLTMVRNPDMVNNGRFPTAVSEFELKYESLN